MKTSAYFDPAPASVVPSELAPHGPFVVVPVFPRLTGVYCLLHRGQLVYVGETTNLVGRVIEHAYPSGSYSKPKVFDRVVALRCADEERKGLELGLIKAFRPPYNGYPAVWDLGDQAREMRAWLESEEAQHERRSRIALQRERRKRALLT